MSGVRSAWATFLARFHPRVWATAFAVAWVGQVLLSVGGNLLPGDSDIYGAPFPVGQGSGYDIIFTNDSSFFLPLWLLNVVVTAAVVLVLAALLEGRTSWGIAAVSLAVVLAYVVVVVTSPTKGGIHSKQILVWVWMLVALGLVWAARYSLRKKPKPLG
jgi:hypothetical protein